MYMLQAKTTTACKIQAPVTRHFTSLQAKSMFSHAFLQDSLAEETALFHMLHAYW